MMKVADYNDEKTRDKVSTGDIIAFSGNSLFSRIIKYFTKSDVSHVGIVFETKVYLHGKPLGGRLIDLIESTIHYDSKTKNITNGVQRRRLRDSINDYDGDVWWLPLREDISENIRQRYIDFLLHNIGKKFDVKQGVMACLGVFDRLGFSRMKEDSLKYFCSELACRALEYTGAIKNVGTYKMTPEFLCTLKLFKDEYYQLKGPCHEISGFNTRPVEICSD